MCEYPRIDVLDLVVIRLSAQDRIFMFSQRFRLNACILDKRTGRRIYEVEEATSPIPPRLDADLDAKTIFANFHDWQLKLTFPETPEVAR